MRWCQPQCAAAVDTLRSAGLALGFECCPCARLLLTPALVMLVVAAAAAGVHLRPGAELPEPVCGGGEGGGGGEEGGRGRARARHEAAQQEDPGRRGRRPVGQRDQDQGQGRAQGGREAEGSRGSAGACGEAGAEYIMATGSVMSSLLPFLFFDVQQDSVQDRPCASPAACLPVLAAALRRPCPRCCPWTP